MNYIRHSLLLILFCGLSAMANNQNSVTSQPKATESKTPLSVGPQNLMELTCDEKSLLKSANGRIERKGKELILWLKGYFEKESAILFRDANKPDRTTFRYCGGNEKFQIVFELFDHDAPMMYLIENNGKKQWYHVGEANVYTTSDSQNILSVGVGVPLQEGQASIVNLLTAKPQQQGSYSGFQFEKALQCDLAANSKMKDVKHLNLSASQLTNEEAIVQAFPDSSAAKEAKAIGTLQLTQKDGKWKSTSATGVLESVKCH